MVNSGRGTKLSGSSSIQMPLTRYTEMNKQNLHKTEFTKPSLKKKEM